MARSGLARRNILPVDKLETLTTRRLLGYLHALHKCYETLPWDDEYTDQLVKDSEEWKKAHADVKSVLGEREHVK